MTKKEAVRMEALLTEAALRRTSAEGPDVPVPEGGQTAQGWTFYGAATDRPSVEECWSTAYSHGHGKIPERKGSHYGSQHGRSLYSTRLRALRALRVAVEQECCRRLRAIDRLIEAEEAQDAA